MAPDCHTHAGIALAARLSSCALILALAPPHHEGMEAVNLGVAPDRVAPPTRGMDPRRTASCGTRSLPASVCGSTRVAPRRSWSQTALAAVSGA